MTNSTETLRMVQFLLVFLNWFLYGFMTIAGVGLIQALTGIHIGILGFAVPAVTASSLGGLGAWLRMEEVGADEYDRDDE